MIPLQPRGMSRFELAHINTLWFMTLGITAISAGMLIYVLLLESALGAFSIREFYPARSTEPQPRGIAVLDSDHTRRLRGIIPGGREDGWYDDLMSTWRTYLDSSGVRTENAWISDEVLEAGRLADSYDVLVLPAALALSDEQVRQIERFLEQGGSVYASWKTGYYRPNGSIRGWRVVESLFGISVVADVDRTEGVYRAYQAIYPGRVEPGFYEPVNNILSGIAERDFPPLSGYRWLGPLTGVPPRSDYARAETTSVVQHSPDGAIVQQPAVRVSYFSWLGDDSGRQTPYPFAGFGMEQITLLGGTPLTIGMPAGYGLFVQVYDPAVRFRITDPKAHLLAYWTDRGQAFGTTSIQEHASMAYGTHGEGRFIYAGFRRDAMGVGQFDAEDITYIDRFFGNVLSYLRRTPREWISDWPAPYSGGALITGIGEDHLEHLTAVGEILQTLGIPSNFFVRPARADLHRSAVEPLPGYGEVGVLDDFAEDTYLPIAAQAERFANLRRFLGELVDGEVHAYRSARPGMLTVRTQLALAQAGYSSVMVDSIERRTTPHVLRETDPRLTQYGTSTWTDRELSAFFNGGPIDITPIFGEIVRLREEGGLYHFVYSSDVFGRPAYRPVIRDIATALVDERFWITTVSEMTRWWRLRRGVRVEMDQSGSSRLVLRISNQNSDPVGDIAVMIDLAKNVESIRIRSELIGNPIPAYELTHDNSRLKIHITALKPLQTRLFHIDLYPNDASGYLAGASENARRP